MDAAAALATHLLNLNRMLFSTTALFEGGCDEIKPATAGGGTLDFPIGLARLGSNSQTELDHAPKATSQFRNLQPALDARLAAIEPTSAAARKPADFAPGAAPLAETEPGVVVIARLRGPSFSNSSATAVQTIPRIHGRP
jgi:hypothetical protein